jgi:hypothetical protein
LRYRLSDAGTLVPVDASADLVTATVWFTLAVGVALVVLGARGRQRWLGFWGVLTCLCCIAYLVAGWLALPGMR